MRCAIALASTVKKRASKRRGRPGGVMARPMKCSALRSGRMFASANAVHGPAGTLAGSRRRHAEQQAGLLEGLADGGERKRARLGGARPLQALHQVRFGVRIERSRDRHEPVDRIDAAARKDELARHEFVALDGACRAAPWARRPERSTRISVAASFGPHIGRGEVALDFVHPL